MEKYEHHHYPTEDIRWQQGATETTVRLFLMGLQNVSRKHADCIDNFIVGYDPNPYREGREWIVLVLFPPDMLTKSVLDALRYPSGGGTAEKPLLLVLASQELSALNKARKFFWPVTLMVSFGFCDKSIVDCTPEEREKILGELDIFGFTPTSSINPRTLEQRPSPF